MDDEVRGVPAEPTVHAGFQAGSRGVADASGRAGAGERGGGAAGADVVAPDGGPERDEVVAHDDGSARGDGVESAVAPAAAGPVPPLGQSILVYTLIRVGLIAALTAVLFVAGRPFGMPLIVALAFALVLQLPLSVVLFRGARNNLTAALARAKERRTAERDRLFAELTGEQPDD